MVQVPDSFSWKSITPDDSPMTLPDVQASPIYQDLSTPNLAVGDDAYDFSSAVYDYSEGVQRETGLRFNLVEASREKPVALIFGSYT